MTMALPLWLEIPTPPTQDEMQELGCDVERLDSLLKSAKDGYDIEISYN